MIYIMNFTWKHSSGCIWHPLAKLEINISRFDDTYEEENQACQCSSCNETGFYFSVNSGRFLQVLRAEDFVFFFISSSKVLFSRGKTVLFFFLWTFSVGVYGGLGNQAYYEISFFSIIFLNIYLYVSGYIKLH